MPADDSAALAARAWGTDYVRSLFGPTLQFLKLVTPCVLVSLKYFPIALLITAMLWLATILITVLEHPEVVLGWVLRWAAAIPSAAADGLRKSAWLWIKGDPVVLPVTSSPEALPGSDYAVWLVVLWIGCGLVGQMWFAGR